LITANPKPLSLPNPEISTFPANQPASQTESISAFCIYKNAQWEIGWQQVQEVILPDFVFSFFIR
jgi:hypothetical protein